MSEPFLVGAISVWWCPAPRDGELVPDYPPVDLMPFLVTRPAETPATPLVSGDTDNAPEAGSGDPGGPQ